MYQGSYAPKWWQGCFKSSFNELKHPCNHLEAWGAEGWGCFNKSSSQSCSTSSPPPSTPRDHVKTPNVICVFDKALKLILSPLYDIKFIFRCQLLWFITVLVILVSLPVSENCDERLLIHKMSLIQNANYLPLLSMGVKVVRCVTFS